MGLKLRAGFSDLRNSRELKSDQCGIETVCRVLRQRALLGSNRTNVGLKLLMQSAARYWCVQLKSDQCGIETSRDASPRQAGSSSNRTNVGLKLGCAEARLGLR